MALLLSCLAIGMAYIVGSVPTAYLVAKAVRGIDIRTVGSGNVGATNVGRVLGFRYFLLVFTVDLLKGFLPTWGLPIVVARLSGTAPAWLPVVAAVAAIVGHNFPVFLGFRGGKGVATSLGAVVALDTMATLASALGFVVFLLVTRIVSLSSMLASLVFAVAHFSRVDRPGSPSELPMTIATIVLIALLFLRHRSNLLRLLRGTEPRLQFRKRTQGGEDTHP